MIQGLRQGAAHFSLGDAFAMSAFEWAVLAAVCGLTLVPGGMALFGGRVLPWFQGRVLAPRMWGAGDLLVGAGAAIGMTGPHWAPGVVAVSGVAAVCMLAGLTLMTLAQRPRRTRRP